VVFIYTVSGLARDGRTNGGGEPLKMDLTEGSETSTKLNLTPGKYPKENLQVSEHGENLKSRNYPHFMEPPVLNNTLTTVPTRYYPKPD
jgi:hypothetical protein